MKAVWVRARWELRSGGRARIVLAVLIALAAGAAMAAAAGARRTETAYPRFLAVQRGFDVDISAFPENVDPERTQARIVRLPQVADWSRVDVVASQVVLPSGRIATPPELIPLADRRGRTGFTVNRAKVLAGRLFDPRTPAEAVIDFTSAAQLHLHVGSMVRLTLSDPTDPHPRSGSVRVVGVIAAPGTFPAIGATTIGYLVLSPAFVRHFDIRTSASNVQLNLRLRGGQRDVPAFLRDLKGLGLESVDVGLTSEQTVGVQRSIRYEVLALWALAGLVAVTALAALGQSLARQVLLDSADHAVLRAIGMSRAQLFALGMVRVATVAMAGAALAIPVSWLLSPLTPIGLGRIAEPTPGFAADPLVWIVGGLVTMIGFSAVGAVPAWRAARAAGQAPSAMPVTGERPSVVAAALARISRSPSASAGVRMALQPGRGHAAVPVRSAALGSAVAVAALAASVLFGASLGRLLDTPRLYGYTWDVFFAVDKQQEAAASTAIQADRQVAVFGRGGFAALVIAGDPFVVFFVDGDPSLQAPIVAGRTPVANNEMAVGPEVLRAVHARIGGTVEVATKDQSGQERRFPMRIVGQAVIAPSPFGATKPGNSITISAGGFSRLYPQTSESLPFLIRFKPGVDREAAIAALTRQFPGAFVYPTRSTSQVVALGEVVRIPLLLSALVAALAAAALSHTLLTSIRRRRREFAILKTLGFVRRQVAGVVGWQATTFAATAALIGLPVGIAVGRWAWRALAGQVGVDPSVAYPLLILVIAPAAVVFANLLALVPARLATRTPVAQVLRSE